jgi:hypothetical protein
LTAVRIPHAKLERARRRSATRSGVANDRPLLPGGPEGGENFVATAAKVGYYEPSFPRVFWGEQPPFTSIGRGGRYFFGVKRKRSTPNVQPASAVHGLRRGERSISRWDSCGRISWPAALTLVALIAAAAILVVFLRLESWPARTTGQATGELERIGRNVRAAFIDIAHLQPRITINNRVYLEQTVPVSELVLVARQVEVEHELLNTWVGSSKRVKLHGTFTVKAGFDLRENLAVDLRSDEIVVHLPHAQILDVAQDRVDVLAFENGFWNRISAVDVQGELASLPQLAREKAAESDLPAQAERALQQQLEQRVHTRLPLKLDFANAAEKD